MRKRTAPGPLTPHRAVDTIAAEVELISQELEVEYSVAMDIHYLRSLEKRVVVAAKSHPRIRDFPVFNDQLDEFLLMLEKL